jgi:hypothetical protein
MRKKAHRFWKCAFPPGDRIRFAFTAQPLGTPWSEIHFTKQEDYPSNHKKAAWLCPGIAAISFIHGRLFFRIPLQLNHDM